MSERLPPTHILTIRVPLRLVATDSAQAPLNACMELVRLAYPTAVCDDIHLTMLSPDELDEAQVVTGENDLRYVTADVALVEAIDRLTATIADAAATLADLVRALPSSPDEVDEVQP